MVSLNPNPPENFFSDSSSMTIPTAGSFSTAAVNSSSAADDDKDALKMGPLVRLERLSISGNLLTRLPETVGSMRSLLLLNVSHNKLKFLPESLGSCSSLEELLAKENSIEELSTSVCSLIHLKSLCLDHNNLKQESDLLGKNGTGTDIDGIADVLLALDRMEQNQELTYEISNLWSQ